MVDATASPRLATIDQAAGGSRAGDDAVCETSIGTRVEDYRKACPGSVFAPAQDPAWIEAWQRHLKPDAVFVTARRDGGTLLAIALEVECRGPFKVARLFGGGHANGNFPPTSHDLAVKQHGAVVDAISRDLRAARPDIDLLALERLAPAWQGIRNPLLALPHGTSPNVALAVDLSGGFEAVLARSSGSKKRKRHRYQQRRLAAAGVVRHIRASDQETASRLLTTFFELKRSQLQRIGVRNVFGDAQVRAFFHDLFGPAAGQSPGRFVLDALEVDGTIRAVTGSSISGGRMICDFAAISDDELSVFSPGDFLFFENIAAACKDGFAVYDFGVGDEPYKRHWCDIETQHFDVWAPLTPKGHALASAMRAKAQLKTLVKRSPVAWRTLKTIRSWVQPRG